MRYLANLLVAILMLPGLALASQGMYPVPMVYQAAGGGIVCTGTSTFIRGASDSGAIEHFDYASSDFCNSDISIASSTGMDTYNSTQYYTGSRSIQLTDGSGTTDPRAVADHGSSQTDQYYRLYVYIPDLPDGATLNFADISKYSSPVDSFKVIDNPGAETERFRVMTSSEYIPIPTLGAWYRVEWRVNDADGSGTGFGEITFRAYTASGTALETTNGGGDYDVVVTRAQDAYRYVHIYNSNSVSTSTTIYIDGFKNCNAWCGGE